MSAPRFVPWARPRWDGARGRAVLVVPEGVVALSDTAWEVVRRCDGRREVNNLLDDLQRAYPGAPRAVLDEDVRALLGHLRARRFLVWDGDAPGAAVALDAPATAASAGASLPEALLCELTYRCPLRCGYCSNPARWWDYPDAMSSDDWCRLFDQAAALGVLHAHLSGGEPLLRDDLEGIVAGAHRAGLYVNLITSAWALTPARLDALHAAGVDHVQVSIQDSVAETADALAGARAHAHKLEAARWVVARAMALSINVVLHRHNLDHLGALVDLAADLGAVRIELANTQFHGSALAHADALLPSAAQLERARDALVSARARHSARMDIIWVIPDWYAGLPRPCMDGWGTRFVTVTPDGVALPCPGAHTLPGMALDRVQGRDLATIWREGTDFQRFRGTAWMPEPCASCDRRTVDHGGCRCQAFALTGDAGATDPTCHKSPQHGVLRAARQRAARATTSVIPLRLQKAR
jgi:pyrroloquinoline quinone biosynthesis protein E